MGTYEFAIKDKTKKQFDKNSILSKNTRDKKSDEEEDFQSARGIDEFQDIEDNEEE